MGRYGSVGYLKAMEELRLTEEQLLGLAASSKHIVWDKNRIVLKWDEGHS